MHGKQPSRFADANHYADHVADFVRRDITPMPPSTPAELLVIVDESPHLFETSYSYMTASGSRQADVKVRSTLGLQNFDEFVQGGLLGATLSRLNAEAMLLAIPYWMLKHLGLDTGGSQYVMLKESLVRLVSASYQNTGFYNPETREREFAAFHFLSILLPTVGGVGGVVDNDRCWRIEWNPTFFRFCRARGGNLLFDLDLYRKLTPASRRLFVKRLSAICVDEPERASVRLMISPRTGR